MSGQITREQWKSHRVKIEADRAKSNIQYYSPRRSWLLFTFCVKLFGALIYLLGLYPRGNRTATKLVLNAFDIPLPNLPPSFDGFQIAHLTDIHFDRLPDLEHRIIDTLKHSSPDLIVLTGDYKDKMKMPVEYYAPIFQTLSGALKPKYGIYATLGNHDTHDLVPIIEASGIRCLLDESVEIEKNGEKLTLTGVDDVHYYFSPLAIEALETAPQNPCKILLVHSPEMVSEAQKHGFSLYLCGHTHSGQIVLPNKTVLIAHISNGKEFAAGRWSYQGMQGYTSSGTGVSGLTLRYNTQSEIALIRLKSSKLAE